MAAAVISPCLATTDCRCTLQIGQAAKRRNCRGQPVGIGNRDGVALGGDGQVTLGQVVFKSDAQKIRRLYNGKVLAGLAKRIVPTLNATSIGTPQDIDAALPSLST